MPQVSTLLTAADRSVSYRVYEPVPASPVSLLLLLHGVGGNELNLASLAASAPADTVVVLARGRLTVGTGQYAWFRVAFTPSGPQIVPREAEESRASLVELIAELQGKFGVPAKRTVIAGFSQGGILSASVALSEPEFVAGFAVLAGRILPELEPAIAGRNRLGELRALISHGRADDKLPVSWAERADAWLNNLGVPHELKLYPVGHELSAEMASDFQDWCRDLIAPMTAVAPLELHLASGSTFLTGQGLGESGVPVAPGVEQLVGEHLSSSRSLAYAMESAMTDIEEHLARVPRTLHGRHVESRSALVREIAGAAGVAVGSVLSRDAVEQVFVRQSAVALGRAAAAEKLPEGAAFVAGLLVTRELMHHLDIGAIALAP